MGRRVQVAVCALAMASARGLAQAPSFTLVGHPATATSSFVHAISADGASAAGSNSFDGDPSAMTWSRTQGRYDFGLESGVPIWTSGLAISGDGATVVGAAANGNSNDRAYRWHGPGTYQSLGTLSGYTQSYGEGVSGNGSVVVGRVVNTVAGVTQAFRWTEAGGMQGLGFLPGSVYTEARGISRDGTSITGDSRDGAGFSYPFVWRQAAGMTILPPLAGSSGTSRAAAVNFDGTLVAGLSGGNPAFGEATLWRNGLPVGLGRGQGFRSSTALALNDDGSVVLTILGSATVPDEAGIWTPSRGMEPLADFFAANGITLPTGWTNLRGEAVSADGTVIAGSIGFGGGVRWEGYVAVIPSPPAAFLLAMGTVIALRRDRRR
jgi:uncharacterized membrane protein